MVSSLGAGGPARAANRVFRRLLGHPSVYDAFHFDHLRPGTALARAAERAGVARATPGVAGRLGAALGPGAVEVLISVFATGAGVAARMRATGRCRRSVVFVPDSTAHRMWVHDQTDLFLVTSPLGAASVRRYRPDAPVEILDPPLREEFVAPPQRAAARRALGLADRAEVVLVMGGAWGLGPVVELAAGLADSGRHVIAVAGRNRALLAGLDAAAATRPRLVPVGLHAAVAEAMAAADLVVTTAGMTCYEARAVGRGLVLLDVVPGHGRENLAHELELGGAAVAQADARSVVDAVEVALASPELRDPAPRDASSARARLVEVVSALVAGSGDLGRSGSSPHRPD